MENNSNPQVEQNYVEVTANDLEAQQVKPVVEPGIKEEPIQGEDQQPEQKPKKMGGYQRRIHNLQNENAELRKMLATNSQVTTQQQQPVDAKNAQPSSDEPKPGDYDDVFKYLADHNRWTAKQELKSFQEQQQAEQKTKAENAEYEEKQATFNERVESTILNQVPDFWERAEALYTQGLITPTIENAILDSDMGEMVSLYFMANPNELQDLVSASEGQVYRAIALIESRLSAGLPAQQQASTQRSGMVQRRVTQAAAPINPVKPAAKTQVSLSDDEMPYEQWKTLREQSIKR